jgi:hypothetical protein
MGFNFNVDSSWMSWTLDIEVVSAIMVNPILVGPGTSAIEKVILSSFGAYV